MTLILITFNELMTADPTEPVLPAVPKTIKEYLTGAQWKEIKKRLREDIGTPNEISNFALIAVFAPCLFLCIPSYNTVIFQQKAAKTCTDLNTELFTGKDVLSVTVEGLFVNSEYLPKISKPTQPEEPQISVITPDKQPVTAAITPRPHTAIPTPQEQAQVQKEEVVQPTSESNYINEVKPTVPENEDKTSKVESPISDAAAATSNNSSAAAAPELDQSEIDTEIPVATELPTSVLVASAPQTEVTPAIKTMSVEVPEGAVPGSTMTVMAPDDITQVVVAVPDDAVPGQTIEVEY